MQVTSTEDKIMSLSFKFAKVAASCETVDQLESYRSWVERFVNKDYLMTSRSIRIVMFQATSAYHTMFLRFMKEGKIK